jgi:hypothetical protein
MSERAADRPEGEKFGRPMKSEVWYARIASVARPKLFIPISEGRYGEVHSPGELGPVRERLAESHSDAERQMLLKLLAEEEAKEPPPKMGNLQPR